MRRQVIVRGKVPPQLPYVIDVSPYADTTDQRNTEVLATLITACYMIEKKAGRPYLVCASDLGAMDKATTDKDAQGVPAGMYYNKDRELTPLTAHIKKDNPKFYQLVEDYAKHATWVFMELSTVLKKKRLDSENFKSLLQSADLPDHLVTIWPIVENLMRASDKTIKDGDPVSTWCSYHIVATSTVELCQKFAHDEPLLVQTLWDDALINHVRACDSEVLDHKIPSKAIADTYCYFLACKYNTGEWYQGKAAIQAMPGPFKQGRVALFTRYLEVTHSVEAIDEVRNRQEIFDLLEGKLTNEQIAERAAAHESAKKIDATIQKAIIKGVVASTETDVLGGELIEVVKDRATTIMRNIARA